MPDNKGKRLPDPERLAIAAEVASGIGAAAVARKHGVSRQTVYAVMKAAKGAVKDGQEFDFKAKANQLNQLSVAAVEAGLCDDADNYKRGNLGVSWLKGTGMLDRDVVQANLRLEAVYRVLTPEWRARCIPNSAARDIEARPVEAGGFILGPAALAAGRRPPTDE